MKNFTKKIYKVLLAFVFLPFVLGACGSGGGGDQILRDGPYITGLITMPDGITPLANTIIFIPKYNLEENILAVTSNDCRQPSIEVVDWSCSDASGGFEVQTSLAMETVDLHIRKGSFTGSYTIDIATLDPDRIEDVGILPMPSDPEFGAPRMAVVTGAFDRMQDILAKIGFGEIDPNTFILSSDPSTRSFDLYNGDLETNLPDFTDLFIDGVDPDNLPDIYQYDIVFINCGNKDEALLFEDLAQIPRVDVIAILRDYVETGGKLYVTDLAYDFVEQAFPEYIDFYGSDLVSAAIAEFLDVAQVGDQGIISIAGINDATLLDWLDGVSCENGNNCLNTDDSISIEGFLSAWALMDGAHINRMLDVKEWISGPVEWDFSQGNGIKPLTVTFNVGDGTVLYSSYHTNEQSFRIALSPQERVLQYLVFEL